MKNYVYIFSIIILLLTGCTGLSNFTDQTKNEKKSPEGDIDQVDEKDMENLTSIVKSLEKQIEGNTATSLEKGKTAVTVNDAIITLNEKSVEKVKGLIKNLDVEMLANLRKDNKILVIEEGSEVKVIEIKDSVAKVEIVKSGYKGYIQVELLEESKTNSTS